MEQKMEQKKDRILVFIPMYNCEKQIPRVIAKIAALGRRQQLFSRVMVVDNRSQDGSLEAAVRAVKTLAIPATVLRNRQNVSLGGSHKVAFNYALEHGYDTVVVLHGDDQGNIADVVPHIESGAYRKYDSFLGSRFMKGSKLHNYSAVRVLGNHVMNAFVSVICLRRITDLGSGLNLYNRKYLESRFYMFFSNGLTFNNYMLFSGVHSRSSFAFFPISWGEDDQVSNAKMFRQAMEIVSMALKFRLRPKSLFAGRPNQYSRMAYESDEIFTDGA